METNELLGPMGEFGNLGALMQDNEEMMGAVQKMARENPTQAERIMRRKNASYIEEFKTWARAEYETRLDMLPAKVKSDLGSGKQQLFDMVYYSIRKVEATVKLFKGDDPVVIGIRNLSNAKLEKDVYALLVGIQILYSPSAVGEIDPANTYKALDNVALNGSVAGLLQGELTLRNSNKTVLKGLPMMRFANSAVSNVYKINPGFYRLDNPKMLEPQQVNEAEIQLAEGITLPANPGYVYAGFWVVQNNAR